MVVEALNWLKLSGQLGLLRTTVLQGKSAFAQFHKLCIVKKNKNFEI